MSDSTTSPLGRKRSREEINKNESFKKPKLEPQTQKKQQDKAASASSFTTKMPEQNVSSPVPEVVPAVVAPEIPAGNATNGSETHKDGAAPATPAQQVSSAAITEPTEIPEKGTVEYDVYIQAKAQRHLNANMEEARAWRAKREADAADAAATAAARSTAEAKLPKKADVPQVFEMFPDDPNSHSAKVNKILCRQAAAAEKNNLKGGVKKNDEGEIGRRGNTSSPQPQGDAAQPPVTGQQPVVDARTSEEPHNKITATMAEPTPAEKRKATIAKNKAAKEAAAAARAQKRADVAAAEAEEQKALEEAAQKEQREKEEKDEMMEAVDRMTGGQHDRFTATIARRWNGFDPTQGFDVDDVPNDIFKECLEYVHDTMGKERDFMSKPKHSAAEQKASGNSLEDRVRKELPELLGRMSQEQRYTMRQYFLSLMSLDPFADRLDTVMFPIINMMYNFAGDLLHTANSTQRQQEAATLSGQDSAAKEDGDKPSTSEKPTEKGSKQQDAAEGEIEAAAPAPKAKPKKATAASKKAASTTKKAATSTKKTAAAKKKEAEVPAEEEVVDEPSAPTRRVTRGSKQLKAAEESLEAVAAKPKKAARTTKKAVTAGKKKRADADEEAKAPKMSTTKGKKQQKAADEETQTSGPVITTTKRTGASSTTAKKSAAGKRKRDDADKQEEAAEEQQPRKKAATKKAKQAVTAKEAKTSATSTSAKKATASTTTEPSAADNSEAKKPAKKTKQQEAAQEPFGVADTTNFTKGKGKAATKKHAETEKKPANAGKRKRAEEEQEQEKEESDNERLYKKPKKATVSKVNKPTETSTEQPATGPPATRTTRSTKGKAAATTDESATKQTSQITPHKRAIESTKVEGDEAIVSDEADKAETGKPITEVKSEDVATPVDGEDKVTAPVGDEVTGSEEATSAEADQTKAADKGKQSAAPRNEDEADKPKRGVAMPTDSKVRERYKKRKEQEEARKLASQARKNGVNRFIAGEK